MFGFVESGASVPLEIARLKGPAKQDKLTIDFLVVKADATDAKALFKGLLF